MSNSLAALALEAATCTKCRISACRVKSVWGEGDTNARLFFIGEAPGYWENQSGRPFAGSAGRMLTKALAQLGLERREVYNANILKCRPPNNRDPTDIEVANCLPYLQAQIDAVNPSVIIVLGRVAAVALGLLDGPLGTNRGHVVSNEDRSTYLTYHPAYIARSPGKYLEWIDDLREAVSV